MSLHDNNIFNTDQEIELINQSFWDHSGINCIIQNSLIPRFCQKRTHFALSKTEIMQTL